MSQADLSPQQSPQLSPPIETPRPIHQLSPRITVEDYENAVSNVALPEASLDAPPSFDTPVYSGTTSDEDVLPDYSRYLEPDQPRLPSYARATHRDSRTATIEELLPTEEERLESLRAFCEEKKYSNDYFGGLEGSPEGPPNDPFKLFRWAKRKMSGEKGLTWKKMSEEQKERWKREGWARDGEVADGDVDTSRVA